MAGFLDKKKRLIDYKLTDFGKEKLALGKLNLKYYTFSDSSIFYDYDNNETNDFRISNSLDSFLPFESEITGQNNINPEMKLDKIISFDDLEKEIILQDKKSNKTISEFLIEKKYLDNFTGKSNNDSKEIQFESREEISSFNFNNLLFSYPTIKFSSENIESLEKIQDDKRFLDKIKNKTLVPLEADSNLNVLEVNNIEQNYKYILKNYNNFSDSIESSRKKAILSTINKLEKDDRLYKLEYTLNKFNAKKNDQYLFELHEVNQENILNKLSFIKLGNFFDEKSQLVKSIYLIGKIILNKKNINSGKKAKVNIDYSFVNMFVLVISQ